MMRVSLPEGSASRSSAVQAQRGRLSDRPAEAQAREAVHLAGAKGVIIESKGNAWVTSSAAVQDAKRPGGKKAAVKMELTGKQQAADPA